MLWHLGHMKASPEGEGRVSEEERDQEPGGLIGERAMPRWERERHSLGLVGRDEASPCKK